MLLDLAVRVLMDVARDAEHPVPFIDVLPNPSIRMFLLKRGCEQMKNSAMICLLHLWNRARLLSNND